MIPSASPLVVQPYRELLDQVACIAFAQAQRRPERAESELKGGAVVAAVAYPRDSVFGMRWIFMGFLRSAVGNRLGRFFVDSAI